MAEYSPGHLEIVEFRNQQPQDYDCTLVGKLEQSVFAKSVLTCARVARKFVSGINNKGLDLNLDSCSEPNSDYREIVRNAYKQFLDNNLCLVNELERKLRESEMQTQKLTVENSNSEKISAEAVVDNEDSISELVKRYQAACKAVIEWCHENEAPKSPGREQQKMQMRYNLMGGKFNYLRAYKYIYADQRRERAKKMRANKSYAKFLLKYARGKARKCIKEYFKDNLKKKGFLLSLPEEVEYSAKKQIYATELRKDGWKRYHTSKSGSLYYTKNREKVRISNHIIKRFEDGGFRTINGWNCQIII